MLSNHERTFAPFGRPDYQIVRTKKTIPAATFAVTLSEAKAWVGVSDSVNDDLLNGIIAGATDLIELYLKRSLISSTYQLTLDRWVNDNQRDIQEGARIAALSELSGETSLELLVPSLLSVVSVVFFDRTSNASIYPTSQYYIDNSDPNQYGRIILNEGAVIPTSLRDHNAVQVTYDAGYGADATSVPYAIKQGMFRLIAHLFNDRGFCADGDGLNRNGAAVDPIEVSGAAGMLKPYQIMRL